MNLNEIKDMLNDRNYSTKNDCNRYALAGYLEIPFTAHKEHCRHKVLKFIYGTPSVKRLEQWQVDNLYTWLQPDKVEGVWMIDEQASRDLVAIYRQAMLDEGQMELF